MASRKRMGMDAIAWARRCQELGAGELCVNSIDADGTKDGYELKLTRAIVDAVSIPVIAAGGIGDGRGIAAAFMLGAEAVQMGTRFLVAKECTVHQNYKDRVLKAKDIDTKVTGRSTGHPIRVLRNDMVRKYLELEKEGAPFEELEKMTLGSLRRAVQEGDAKNGSLMAGQIVGMIKEERSCEDIIKSTVSDACRLMNGVSVNE